MTPPFVLGGVEMSRFSVKGGGDRNFPLERGKFSEIGKCFRKGGVEEFPLEKNIFHHITSSSSTIFMFSVKYDFK